MWVIRPRCLDLNTQSITSVDYHEIAPAPFLELGQTCI